MKKNWKIWICLAVCLCLAGCTAGKKQGNEEKKALQESQDTQNTQVSNEKNVDDANQNQKMQTAHEGNGDDADQEQDKDQKIQTGTEGDDVESKGEKVEFLGSDRVRLQECFIYYEGEKEEIQPSEADGFLKILSELIDETKPDWDTALSLNLIGDPEELRVQSEKKYEEGRYFIWLRFDEPPLDDFKFGNGEEQNMDVSDKFYVEIEQEDGEICLNYNLGAHEGAAEFYACGTTGKQDEIDRFLKEYEEWKADKFE